MIKKANPKPPVTIRAIDWDGNDRALRELYVGANADQRNAIYVAFTQKYCPRRESLETQLLMADQIEEFLDGI